MYISARRCRPTSILLSFLCFIRNMLFPSLLTNIKSFNYVNLISVFFKNSKTKGPKNRMKKIIIIYKKVFVLHVTKYIQYVNIYICSLFSSQKKAITYLHNGQSTKQVFIAYASVMTQQASLSPWLITLIPAVDSTFWTWTAMKNLILVSDILSIKLPFHMNKCLRKSHDR